MDHQFSIFSFNETKPVKKVPISRERIEEARRLMFSDPGKAAANLREVRESLERFEQRITNGKEASQDN